MTKEIKELIELSQYGGGRADYTQGGGGNTSVKTEDALYIKASGYRLKDITEQSGYVELEQKALHEFILTHGTDRESENAFNALMKSVNRSEGLRPSVEAGFHALLGKYVLHTHSMYAAAVVCAQNSGELIKEIMAHSGIKYTVLPYLDPGYYLAVQVRDSLKSYRETHNGNAPDVIFLENHGLVVAGDDFARVIEINEFVNNAIKSRFNVKYATKKVLLDTASEGVYSSTTPEVLRFLSENNVDKEFLDAHPLFPDMLVFLNKTMTLEPSKIVITGDRVTYNASLKQATAFDEAFLIVAFVLNCHRDNGIVTRFMNQKDVDFINNWEAEKYRRTQN